jgi:hypothetical protein
MVLWKRERENRSKNIKKKKQLTNDEISEASHRARVAEIVDQNNTRMVPCIFLMVPGMWRWWKKKEEEKGEEKREK